MGTNYYLRIKDEVFNKCPKIIQNFKNEIQGKLEIHIGKSSAGWRFLFHEAYINQKKIVSFKQWKEVILDDNFEIVDEYGKVKKFEEFEELVNFKQDGQKHNYRDSQFISEDGYDFDTEDFS